MSLDQIVAEAMRLPVAEKVQLAQSLWESLGDPYRTEEAEDEALKLALERDAELERGDITAVPHHEMMRRLRE